MGYRTVMATSDHTRRAEIRSQSQHPYRHVLSEFIYNNPSLPPGFNNVEQVLNYMLAVIYPNTQPAVADPASLPLAGNTINDYRVVNDDGDGKAASYRWEQREGDASPSWYKVYDIDWGFDSILSGTLDKTQELYVKWQGYDQLDGNGDAYTGDDAGQWVYGGLSANTHLNLFANSGDGVGPQTGFIQFFDQVRPRNDSEVALGETTRRWLNVWSDALNSGTMTITSGSITDTSGAISFGDENLSTSGTMTIGTMLIQGGQITDTSGAISFGDENLSTTGTVTANSVSAIGAASSFASGTTIGNLTLSNGSIIDSSGDISFGDENLSTTGTLSAGLTDVTRLDVDDIRLDGNLMSIETLNTDLQLQANGTGVIRLLSDAITAGLTVTGAVGITGSLTVDNLSLDGNTITTLAGPLTLNATTNIEVFKDIIPDTGVDLGSAANAFTDFFMNGSVSDGITSITSATLQSFRDANVGVSTGDALFWTGTKWEASNPDTEIEHGQLAGLGDDDHSQYALLAGRGNEQILYGGVNASGNLLLRSTFNATKGYVFFQNLFAPEDDGLSDIGDATHRVQDFYQSGQLRGSRLENFTTAGRPSAAASTEGRMIYDTDLGEMFIDNGGAWEKQSAERYTEQDAAGWTGTETSAVYTPTGIEDCRFAQWTFHDNANGFQEIMATITVTITQVTVTVITPLPAGTYTLKGVA